MILKYLISFCFVFAFSQLSKVYKVNLPCSSGTLAQFYGMKCCPVIELNMKPIQMVKQKARSSDHICNLSYSGGKNQHDHKSRPVRAKRLQDPIQTHKRNMMACDMGGFTERSWFSLTWARKLEPILKLTKAKKDKVSDTTAPT
jgi:hypothetical protein